MPIIPVGDQSSPVSGDTPRDTPSDDTDTKQCTDDDNKGCSKASAFQLGAARIFDAHAYKDDFGAVPNSRFDICACKDGRIIIKAQGQCGSPGPSIETGDRWK